jgi:hypothetical protein
MILREKCEKPTLPDRALSCNDRDDVLQQKHGGRVVSPYNAREES